MSDNRSEIRAVVRELAALAIVAVGRPGPDDNSTATITRRDLCRICDEVADQAAEIARLTAERDAAADDRDAIASAVDDLPIVEDDDIPGGRAGAIATIRNAASMIENMDAEIARLTAELAAARAVPADVEAAIDAHGLAAFEAGNPSPTLDGSTVRLKVAINRAINYAIAEARQPATVGGLLATAPLYSVVEYMDVDGDVWHQVEFHATMTAHRSRRVGDMAWGPWRQRDMPQREMRQPARIVPFGKMRHDPSTRGPLPKGG